MTDVALSIMINDFIKKTRKNLNVVKVLMDQNGIVSGIGNYLVAEILYDAKINPHKKLTDLTAKKILQLAHSMKKIVKRAYYDNKTGYMDNFKNFMAKHKERVDKNIFPNYHPDIKIGTGFQFKVYGQETDPKGNKVKQDNIIKDRTIHWVPKIQK